ncbi:MAG: tetratricopeptide repeat protein [Gammaproteobacteria bacterium]|nr:tetratricopeptide repeat protein [Gammaproteobacteria bacterium]
MIWRLSCFWGFVLLGCFASEEIRAAEAGDRSSQATPPTREFEYRDGADEPAIGAAIRCYQTALERGRELATCDQAVAEASDDRNRVAAYANRALILSNRDDFAAALADIEHAVEILPNVPALLINRGNLLWRMRRFDEAWQSYQDAIDENTSRSALAHYNRVFVHRVRGDIDLATRDLETARRLLEVEAQFEQETLFRSKPEEFSDPGPPESRRGPYPPIVPPR